MEDSGCRLSRLLLCTKYMNGRIRVKDMFTHLSIGTKRSCGLVVLATLSLTFLPIQPQANTIVAFDTLSFPGNSGDGVIVADLGFFFEQGARFTASASGVVDTVDLALTSLFEAPEAGASLRVYLYADDFPTLSPNTAIETFLGSVSPTEVSSTSFPTSFVSLSVPGNVLLSLGSAYWLVLKPSFDDDAAGAFLWVNSARIGVKKGRSGSFPEDPWSTSGAVELHGDGGPPFLSNFLPAFRINVRSSVPDASSSLALLGFALTVVFALNLMAKANPRA